VVGAFDLRADLPDNLDPTALVGYMGRDKKAHHDLTFVLDGPQGVEPVRGIDQDEVLATLAQMAGRS
jgi:5-deoxy-5-amino-3-dehydroquinate synthase